MTGAGVLQAPVMQEPGQLTSTVAMAVMPMAPVCP